jgi:cytochrome c5
MNLNHPKPVYQIVLALFIAAFTITACNNSSEKKEEPAKTDTPAVTKPAEPAPNAPDSLGGDTLKLKPTAPGD